MLRAFVVLCFAANSCLTVSMAAPDASPAAAAESSPPEVSLVSLYAGAYVVKRPKEWMDDESAFHMLDENPRTKYASPRGDVGAQTIVIALPDRTLLKTLEFDNSHIDSQFTGCSAKDLVVEMSDTNENDGFKKIAEVSLQDQQDHQRFPVSAEVAGRWVRLTIKNNHNPEDKDNTIELTEFRAFGTQLTHTPMVNVSGTYETYFTDKLHLKQEGLSVSGCYEARHGRFDGGIDGRALKFTYYEELGGHEKECGIGVMVFSPDGKQVFSVWDEYGGRGRLILGTKQSDEVGTCPEWLKLMKEIAAADAPPVEPVAVPETTSSLPSPAASASTPAAATVEASATPEPTPEQTPTPEESASSPPSPSQSTPSPTAETEQSRAPAALPTIAPSPSEPAKPVTIAQAQLTSEIAEFGRARVYGINFDSDSDRIKEESRSTLDNIVAMMKRKSGWRMSIEGHTDSSSTPQHNQQLSERRAASVKNYLVAAGIASARLTTTGYGQDRPIAPNDSPMGKAQNRRVELVKQQ